MSRKDRGGRPAITVDPETLSDEVDTLHDRALYDDGDTVLSPIAEEHFHAAVAALASARAAFRLAHYYATRNE